MNEPRPASPAIIALAAGASRRFGAADKLLAGIGDEPLVLHCLKRLASVELAGSRPLLLVVVPELDGPVARVIASALPFARLVVNPAHACGIGTSVAAGIAALPADCLGALVTPSDMPALEPDFVAGLFARFLADGCRRPVHAMLTDGSPVAPMVWPRRLFGRLRELEGDRGGRALLADEAAIGVPIPPEQTRDIDTQADLEYYRRPQLIRE